ncbi:MAG: universal stress protein [Candidatus Methanomethyliaceae archaeon]|nr:universal stress protein [Candidatus Methanomethyliaceae archaeon]MDW7970805.1 universal stress protein [Nitrososphaerota archaeon]
MLVPIDGSPASLRALDLAIDIAMRDGAKIALIYVVANSPGLSTQALEDLKSTGEKILNEAESRCKCYGILSKKIIKVAEINQSSVAMEIYDEVIKGKYDLVVLGSRGYIGEKAILMGSVAMSLAITLPCTIIIVR